MTPSIRSEKARIYLNSQFAGTADKVEIGREYWTDPIDHKCYGAWDNNTVTPYMSTNQSMTIKLSTNNLMATRDALANLRKDWYWDTTSTQFTAGKTIPPGATNQFVQPPPGFNRYVNASDLLEEFIGFLGDEKVRQDEVMGLPVELFIKWLVVRACEEDGDEPNVVLEIPAPTPQPRCLGCQKFMRKGTEFPLHGRRCAAHLFTRKETNDQTKPRPSRVSAVL